MNPPHEPDSPAAPERLPDDVRGALAGLLAPPDTFRERVRRRAAELEREEEERGARLARAPERLRIAAGLLPPGLLPTGLALGAGKSLSTKGLAVLLAAPAVSFVMVLVTLVAGARALWRLRSPDLERAPDEQPEDEAGALVAAWWRRNRAAAVVSLLVIVLLTLLGHSEAALFLVLLSTAAAALLLEEIARAGLADRAQVSRRTAAFLGFLGLYGFMLRDWLPPGASATPPITFVAIVILGVPLCLAAGGQLTARRLLDALDAPVQRMRYPDLPSVLCLRGLMGLLALAAFAGLLLLVGAVALAFVPQAPSRARLVRYASTFDAPVNELARWDELEHVLALLETDGGERPELTVPARVVAAALEQGVTLPAVVQRAAARFGLVSPKVLARWSRSGKAEFLRTTPTTTVYPDVHGAALYTLLAVGALDGEARRQLADGLEARWPEPEAQNAVQDLRSRVELLEALGERARVAAHGADLRAAVVRAWPATHVHWRPTTAFLFDAESASGPAASGGARFRPSLWAPTDDALGLLARTGLPDELDLAPLRAAVGRALVQERGLAVLTGSTEPGLELVAVRLEELLPRRHAWAPGWLGVLIERRLLLAVLGLVALCVVASARGARTSSSGGAA